MARPAIARLVVDRDRLIEVNKEHPDARCALHQSGLGRKFGGGGSRLKV
jgi:hypothetical protein